VLTIAEGGLERRARRAADGAGDERVFLTGLKRLVEHAACPADALLAAYASNGDALTVRALEAVRVAGPAPV
jgi:gamma-glutamylcysteine synthetase